LATIKTIPLYELASTLTASEKGYCSKQLNQQSSKTLLYVKLYKNMLSQIDKTETHGELDDLLESKVKSLLGKQSYASAKNYLYNQLLKFLQDFNASSNITQQLSDLLNQSYLLSAKRLRKQSIALLEKGIAIAKKNDLYAFESLLGTRRLVLLKLMNQFEGMDEKIEDNNQAILRHNTFQNLDILRCKIMEAYHIYYNFDNNHPKVKALWNDPLISEPLPIKTYKIENLHLKNLSGLYTFNHDLEQQITIIKQHLDLPQKYPEEKNDPVWKLVKTYNYLQHVIMLKRMDLMDEAWKLFNSSDTKAKGVEGHYYFKMHLVLLQFYTFGVDEKSFELEIGQYNHVNATKFKYCPADKKISIPFHIALVYFDLGKFNQTLHWIDVVYSTGKEEVKRNYRTASRIIEIIAHYELGNIELIEPLLRSTYRYFQKLNKKTALDNATITFLRKLATVGDSNDLTQLLIITKKKIDDIAKNPAQATLLDYFDLQSWLNSKITGKPFAELRRSKS